MRFLCPTQAGWLLQRLCWLLPRLGWKAGIGLSHRTSSVFSGHGGDPGLDSYRTHLSSYRTHVSSCRSHLSSCRTHPCSGRTHPGSMGRVLHSSVQGRWALGIGLFQLRQRGSCALCRSFLHPWGGHVSLAIRTASHGHVPVDMHCLYRAVIVIISAPPTPLFMNVGGWVG